MIATSPPLVAAIPGWLAAKWHGARLIFEIRDLWPESAVTTACSEGLLAGALLYAMERWACRRADVVNVLTPAFRETVKRGLASEKIAFVPNGADLDTSDRLRPIRRSAKELGWGDRFVVMYAGAHGRANAIGQLVETAALLRDRKDILIASVGDGPERKQHEDRAKAMGLATSGSPVRSPRSACQRS